MWKYLRSVQWCWEMDSTSLLAKTGQTEAVVGCKNGLLQSTSFLTQNAVGVGKFVRSTFFDAISGHVSFAATPQRFLQKRGTDTDPSGCLWSIALQGILSLPAEKMRFLDRRAAYTKDPFIPSFDP